jgi:hypothetical protein
LVKRDVQEYLGLIGDIEDKMQAIEKIVFENVVPLTAGINKITGKIPGEKLMALAGYLHHFYTGVEDILSRIIKVIDGGIKGGGDWHQELLYVASRKTPELRPTVISPEMYEILNEYRSFRHLFRHAYARELRWRKMDHLALNLPEVWQSFRMSMDTFIRFLKKIVENFQN